VPTRDLNKNETSIQRVLTGWIDKAERKVVANYKIALDKIRADMAIIYEKYAVDGKLTLAQMTQYNRLQALEKQIADTLRKNYRANVGVIKRLSPAVYEESFWRHAWAFDQNSGVAIKWGVLQPDAILEAAKNPMVKIATTRLRGNGLVTIQQTVVQGLIQGKSYPQMSSAIRDSINGNAYDATRIVRTEGQRAVVQGQDDLYERAEKKHIEGKVVWDATLDNATRPAHQRMDGKVRGNDGYFNSADVGKVPRPLASGFPSFDIHCRCRLRFEDPEYPPVVRRSREDGLLPYQTYDQWGGTPKAGIARALEPGQFTTVKEAQDWCMKNIPGMVDPNFQGITDPRILNGITRAIKKELDEVGEFQIRAFTKTHRRSAIADYDLQTKSMGLNPKILQPDYKWERLTSAEKRKRLEETIKVFKEEKLKLGKLPSYEQKILTKSIRDQLSLEDRKDLKLPFDTFGISDWGDDISQFTEFTISHELGHAQYFQHMFSPKGKTDKRVTAFMRRLSMEYNTRKRTGTMLSGYSFKDEDEMFAEAYAVFRNNLMDLPSEFLKMVQGAQALWRVL
jgi:SPP1 gp7 family putative phage head morphogenesis protein